jgi:NADP-dependent aldehyde dehydrogenase
MNNALTGRNFIGFERSAEGNKWFNAIDPASGELIEQKFFSAEQSEVDRAMQKADQAFYSSRNLSGTKRADFLEAIAIKIEAAGEDILEIAVRETGLPAGRISGERTRTINQIRMFAGLIREGSWVEASIDTAIPDRLPLPKPDIRKMLRPTGPVVVFGSSNFPLAFSVAGGDTISALAAGNPVVVKAHPAHPGTSEVVANCIQQAALETRMPDGIFSMLFDSGYTIGQSLVLHPLTKSVGFTGSYAGGMALYKLAQSRPDPIPVFAEMGSTNPVFVLPGATSVKGASIAASIAASVNLGAGQYCTNPGLIFIVETPDSENFIRHLKEEVSKSIPQTMLTPSIYKNYGGKVEGTLSIPGVNTLSVSGQEPSFNQALPLVAMVKAEKFEENPALAEEIFGPYSLLVLCRDSSQMEAMAGLVAGQLTATIFHEPGMDTALTASLTSILTGKAGRIIYNGVPTGVEVCHSTQHGGPFPASTDGRFTSVGTGAIKRFVRPVAYQDCPENLLPAELQTSNPLNILRLFNGQYTR